MNKYTLCPYLIKNSTANQEYYFNVLCKFAQRNSWKICIDNQQQAVNIYEQIGRSHEMIRSWLQYILYSLNSIEIININNSEYEDIRLLFIEIAANVYSDLNEKKLLVESKQAYIDLRKTINERKIKLMDKDEFMERLNTNININQTSGANSPINTGSSNEINYND